MQVQVCARSLLDESEKALQKEHSQVAEEGLGPIQAALSNQSGLFMGYDAIQKEQQAALGKARSSHEAADIAKRFQKKLATQEKYIRMGLVETHPVFADPNLPFEQIFDFYKNGSNRAFKAFLQQNLGEKYENIQKTRANLNEEPSLIWSLEKVIQLTAGNMPLLNDPIYHELAMQEFERRKRNDTIIRSAMAAISIGLAIASFGSMSGVSAVILGGLSVGVSGIDAYMTYQEYDQIAPAGNTTFNPEKVLTNEDPSVVWVIASVAGAVGDTVQLIKLAQNISKLSKVQKLLQAGDIEKVTEKLVGKTDEAKIAEIQEGLELIKTVSKLRTQIARQVIDKMKGKIDYSELQNAIDTYMIQHADELLETGKSGKFKLSAEAQQEIKKYYEVGGEGKKIIGTLEDASKTKKSGAIKVTREDLSKEELSWIDNFVINRPPMHYGIMKFDPLSSKGLRFLSNELGGMEVAQVYIKDGKNVYYSIIYGTPGRVVIPKYNGTPYLINHVHPSGNSIPSKSDIELLTKFQKIQQNNKMPVQKSSQIIPFEQPNKKFNVNSETLGE